MKINSETDTPTTEAVEISFRSLGLDEPMLKAVEEKGFETPSPIQQLTIPALLRNGRDMIAQAQTGTGKTAAYGLPLLQLLSPAKGAVQAIVLVPTRELALQVTEELLSFNHVKKLSIAAIYGGASISEQLRRLSKGIDIVVGTPGRVLDHIRRKTLDLSQVRYLVLDEADEMLNMGFVEDVEAIIGATSEQRRVLLFSATMPERIVKLSKAYMREVEMLKVEARHLTVDLTDQIYFEVREGDKFDALTRIIDVQTEFYGIVFSRTKVGVDELVTRLLERGYAAEGLHGDVSQGQREKILRKFRNRNANILVATDVAARGIDINNLTHVINYSLPQDSESYVHRIGRTGRAGNQGTAITFISPSEFRQFGFLKRDINADIKKETLPTPQDIVAMKREKIKNDLTEVVESEDYFNYTDMAKEILEQYSSETALSALLKMAFKNDLDENQYPEIRSFSVDRKGTARLFIGIGRLDGYDPRKMVALLKRECGLSDRKIDDLKVMDSYSFVSVPFADAQNVVHQLNKIRGKGKKPLAEITKEDRGAKSTDKTIRKDRSDVKRESRPKRTEPKRNTAESDSSVAPSAQAPKEHVEEKDTFGEITRQFGKVRGYREAAPGDNSELGTTGTDTHSEKKMQPGGATSNSSFDWSFFERDGNKWEERGTTRKTKEKKTASTGGKAPKKVTRKTTKQR